MSALLRRLGLFLVRLANRLELEPMAFAPSTYEDTLFEIRHRSARYY